MEVQRDVVALLLHGVGSLYVSACLGPLSPFVSFRGFSVSAGISLWCSKVDFVYVGIPF